MAYTSPWTSQETEIMRRMLEKGKGYDEIALVIRGRTLEAIQNKAYRMGLSVRSASPEIDADLYRTLMGEDPVQI